MAKDKTLWGVWCFDNKDWLRAARSAYSPILAYESKRVAMKAAALEYCSFDSYSDANRKGWCEVRELAK